MCRGSKATQLLLGLALLGSSGEVPSYVRDRRFTYKSYKDTYLFFEGLRRDYPDIVETWYAQDVFPEILPTKDVWGQCGGEPCRTLVVRIANKALLTRTTPEVYFSGALHGDERSGPITVTELAAFLCANYKAGHEDVRRLVDYRATWITPLTNALGYAQNRREENGMDPNRDFGYLQDPQKCMMTQTARTVNELFRRHLFHFTMTFHGGMRALTYEWGSKNHMTGGKSTEAPDNSAYKAVGESIQAAAGKNGAGHWWYPFGPINDLVYAVDGGMEDWSYGAGWENSPNPITVCKPTSYGGYPPERTKYRNNSVATLVYLAEMDDAKGPEASSLGSMAEIWSADGVTQGHVPRNMRMCLKLIELARPEVVIGPGALSFGTRSALPGAEVLAQVRGFGCQEISSIRLLLVADVFFGSCGGGHDSELEFNSSFRTDMLAKAKVIGEVQHAKCRGLSIWESAGKDDGIISVRGRLPQDASGQICLLIAAEFDQHWGAQVKPDPEVSPRAHATRIRTEGHYGVQASDGDMIIDSYRTKLFAANRETLIVGGSTTLAGTGTNSKQPASEHEPVTLTVNKVDTTTLVTTTMQKLDTTTRIMQPPVSPPLADAPWLSAGLLATFGFGLVSFIGLGCFCYRKLRTGLNRLSHDSDPDDLDTKRDDYGPGADTVGLADETA